MCKSIEERIKKDTWEKVKPMIYMDNKGRIIKHCKCEHIVVLKESKT